MLFGDETSSIIQDDCMCRITYDYSTGYEKAADVIEEKLDSGNVSLITDLDKFVYEERATTFLSPRDLVLQKCGQTEPQPFGEAYQKHLLQNCHKIGEGVYGEVFLYKNQHATTTVMKIIPVEGNQMVNGQCQRKFEDVLSEIIIAQKLSNLRYSNKNQTSGFIEVENIKCVQGTYPDDLVQLWDLFDETRGSENDSPEMFRDEQLYVILESSYGGNDLESFIFDDASQVYALVNQVAWTLAIAEEELQFEHRDLHWGNILISRVPNEDTIAYKLNDRNFEVKSYGVKLSLIDFNLSRIDCNGVTLYSDISQDSSYFSATGDYQFEVYRLMKKKNSNDWRHFEPFTNVLWLSYIIDKAISSLHYKNCGKKHREYLRKLKNLNLEILGFDSAREFVTSFLQDKDVFL